MKDVQEQALNKALNILRALKDNVQFKVITLGGEEYGDLEVVVPKTRQRKPKIEYAGYVDLYKNKMNEAQVGDVLQFPVSVASSVTGGTPESLRSTITAYACHVWGKGNYTSTITDTHVEIMRLD